jgi:hypothetical protein
MLCYANQEILFYSLGFEAMCFKKMNDDRQMIIIFKKLQTSNPNFLYNQPNQSLILHVLKTYP